MTMRIKIKTRMVCWITQQTCSPALTENINFTFAWVYPDEVPRLAAATGFEVERVYGDFNGGAFSAQAQQQIWELRKPLKGVG